MSTTLIEPVAAAGLVGVLDSAVSAMRGIAQDFPTWSLSEVDVAAAIGSAQELRELARR
jgi:hypothetical protein